MSRAFRTLAVLSVLGSGIAAQDDSSWFATDRASWFATFGAGLVSTADTEGPMSGDTDSLSYDPGYSVNLGLGKYLIQTTGFRGGVHGEILFNSFEFSNQTVDTLDLGSDRVENLTFMLSAVGDFYLAPQFSVYLAGGVGYTSRISIDGLDAVNNTLLDESVISAQFRTGFKYALGSGYDVGLGYRYFQMDTVEIDTNSSEIFGLDFKEHIIEVVLHWGF
jgi:opacity protein-like surface antigen